MSLPHRKGYATAEEAMRSKAYTTNPGATIELCPCTRYHVNAPKPPPAPLKVSRRDTGPDTKTREAVKDRSGGICEYCGIRRGEHVHHRQPRQRGGTRRPWINKLFNLLHLCAHCHEWAETHREQAYVLGLLVPYSKNPELVPIKLDSPDGFRVTVWLTADGARSTEAPEGVAA